MDIANERPAGEQCTYLTRPPFCVAANAARAFDGATTVHSFVGAGLAAGAVDELVGLIRADHRAVSRWQTCKALVIDEVR